ncbi:putative holin [Utexia brackfieldae]|uniref:putative holin n=1 Tax=Utexia brackfieldae TaxID=3074108 RepID=UPI00370DC35C
MAEPTTTTTTTALISAFSISALFPNLDANVVLGALCGATVLIIKKREISRFKSVLLFFASFLIGILFADFMASVISNFAPDSITVPNSLGALVVSVLITQLLLLIIDQDLASLIKLIRGKI